MAEINHHTRAPNQPTEATIVEGEFDNQTSSGEPALGLIPYIVMLARIAPGLVEFTLKIDGKICGKLPFDNLVKAAVRIDPDYATGPERQIQDLREKLAKAEAKRYEEQARADQLEARLAAVSETSKA